MAASVSVAAAEDGPQMTTEPSANFDLDRSALEFAQRLLGELGDSRTSAEELYRMSERAQLKLVSSIGLHHPGGSLLSIDVQDYLLGQLEIRGGDHAIGVRRVLASGLSEPEEGLKLFTTLSVEDYRVSKAELEDVMAALPQLDRSSAAERARLQLVASDLRPLLRDLDPGYYALVVSEKGLEYSTSTELRGTELSAVLNEARAAELTYLRSEISETDLIAMSESVAERISGTLGATRSRWIQVLKFPAAIEVRVGRSDAAPSELLAVEAAVEEATGGSAVRGIVVEVSDELSRVHESSRKGGMNASSCTWGFVARQNSNNANRLTTAAHCGNTQLYTGVLQFFVDEELARRTDMQTHAFSAGATPTNVINRTGRSDRAVTSRGRWRQYDVDDVACHQGATTGWSCGVMESVTESSERGTGGRWVRVGGNAYISDGGDSGGPYMFGFKALGTHESGDGVDGWFGPLNFSEIDLGIQIRTS